VTTRKKKQRTKPEPEIDILVGWPVIADFLGKSVKTVQRWAKAPPRWAQGKPLPHASLLSGTVISNRAALVIWQGIPKDEAERSFNIPNTDWTDRGFARHFSVIDPQLRIGLRAIARALGVAPTTLKRWYFTDSVALLVRLSPEYCEEGKSLDDYGSPDKLPILGPAADPPSRRGESFPIFTLDRFLQNWVDKKVSGEEPEVVTFLHFHKIMEKVTIIREKIEQAFRRASIEGKAISDVELEFANEAKLGPDDLPPSEAELEEILKRALSDVTNGNI